MAAPKKRITLTLKDCRIMYRNFEGRAGMFNKEGERSFAVVIPDELVETLIEDGWNVKFTKPREEDDIPVPHIPVKVSWDIRPPRIVLVTSTGKKPVSEATAAVVDQVDIERIDLVLNGSIWDVNGKQGMKAYLKTMVVTINEDEIERQYKLNESDGKEEADG